MVIISKLSKRMTVQQRRKLRKIIAPFRRIGLRNKTFSLISNNCWGGIVYDKFGLKYRTPTIGLLFRPSDYLKFVKNLPYYLSLEATPDYSSAGREIFHARGDNNLFFGKLGDLTLYFVHYKNVEDAVTKWNKRRKRVALSSNNIFLKLCDMPVAGERLTDEEVEQFAALPYKKVLFTINKTWANKYRFAIFFKKTDKEGNIANEFKESSSLFPLSRIKKILNSIDEKKPTSPAGGSSYSGS